MNEDGHGLELPLDVVVTDDVMAALYPPIVPLVITPDGTEEEP